RADVAPMGPTEVPATGDTYFAPETSPAASPGSGAAVVPSYQPSVVVAAGGSATSTARCVGCGGIASALHSCGAPLCQHCIGSFPNCPKCGQPISTDNTRAATGAVMHSASGTPAHGAGGGGIRGVFQRVRSPSAKADSATPRKEHPAGGTRPPTDRKGPAPSPAPAGASGRKEAAPASAGRAGPAVGTTEARPPAPKVPEPPAPPATPAVKPRREKADDEPRL
ncbi:MAG: hypothetical protein ACREEC_00365, partial [Thermoplasmata archaeon]